ncbi:MAG: chorismate mutase [Lachnospiraceae bacterium]|nr:chorismate mutase [Lachnospiraceae bacterium]
MNLDEVRVNIDRVDKEIRKLFIERMELADNVARIKAQTEDEIYKPDREEAIIRKNTEGIDEKLLREYTALIKRIMEVSRKYQYGRTLEIRDCFPYEFDTRMAKPESVAMLKSELYMCDGFSKDRVLCVDNYDEMARLIVDGKIDAGMGVMEEIGKAAEDGLNTALVKYNLYINSCRLIEENGRKLKLVTFSKKLVVDEQDNRLKIMFVCPNRSGSLGSLLCQISDYGVNLTEIHSRPNGETKDWNYEFYAELSLNLLGREAQALIFQLSKETQYLQILGSFRVEE